MNRDSVIDWQELSALYEQADELDAAGLAAMRAGLRAQGHRLLPQLERMLDAREQVATGRFLHALPQLEAAEHATGWGEGGRVGPYRLLRHLGSGGMAEVWLADRVDGAFSRRVAIKLLFRQAAGPRLPGFVQRFARERDILASLRHPNIAGLHDAGVTPDGQPWLALEFVEGRTITTWCDAQGLALTERIGVFRQVLLAVQHAHANLVIHRDLKPANILVTPEGQVRLLDFGIAKLLEPEGGGIAESELTREGGRPLTPQYASPEQVLGQPLGTGADVYSLGVVLYELLCGERPYELTLGSVAQIEQAIVALEPRLPSRRVASIETAKRRSTTPADLARTLSPDLDAVVCKCLAKQAGSRYSSVEALDADLVRWLEGRPVVAKASGAFERALKFTKRHRLAVVSTALAVSAMLGLTVLALVMGLRARDESARAVAARDFLVEMFRVADPDRAKGVEPTARHILEAASDRAVVDLRGQPDLLSSVLEVVAQMQGNMGLFTVADATLARLATLYEGLGRQRDLAMVQTSRALNAYQLGEDERASRLIEVAAVAAAPFPADHELQAKLLLTQGWIARGAGRYAQARDAMGTAMAQAAMAYGPNHVQTIEAMRGLAEVEAELGHHDVAMSVLADAVVRAGKDASADERYREEVAIARAHGLLRAGRAREAASVAGQLMPVCERLSGRHNVDCDFLRRLWAFSLLQSGGPVAALPLADDLLVASQNESSPVLQAVSTITLVRILAESKGLSARAELQPRLADIASRPTTATVYRVQAWLTLAEVGLVEGRYDDAEAQVRRAMALLEAADAPPLAGRAKVTLALALAARGREAEALALLDSAQPDLESNYGKGHPWATMYGLNRAAALQRARRPTEALAILDAALPSMRSAMGDAAPLVRRMESLRNDCLRSTRIPAESARFADMFL